MNAINWFEVPALDFDRAVSFYETVLGVTMHREVFNGDPNGFFPYNRDNGGVGGSVVKADYNQPSTTGVLIYLNAQSLSNLDVILSRVQPAGGEIVMPKTDIGPVGVMAIIQDSEGNRVGLHTTHDS